MNTKASSWTTGLATHPAINSRPTHQLETLLETHRNACDPCRSLVTGDPPSTTRGPHLQNQISVDLKKRGDERPAKRRYGVAGIVAEVEEEERKKRGRRRRLSGLAP
ncbi:hypothetical protein TB2_009244 [Malus domestica]